MDTGYGAPFSLSVSRVTVCTHVCVFVCVCTEEAKRFEEGLQEQKDFLYIQKKYVRIKRLHRLPVPTLSFP